MYFNTTNEPDVKDYVRINNKQDTKILAIIREIDKPFGASDVYKKYLHKHVMEGIVLTSVRRSINALKRAGYIEETGKRVQGMFKRSELEYCITK